MNIDTEKLNADGGEGQPEGDALEIEISNEDLSTSDSTAAEEKVQAKTLEDERKKKNRVPADKRIGQLTRKVHDATERATVAETHAQRLQREVDEERGKRGLSEKAALGTYVKLADANLKLAKQEHAEAQNSGDADKIADATAKLSAAAAEKANVDNYVERTKAEAKPEGTKTTTERTEETQQRPKQEPLKPEAERWTKETTWFNPNSPEFDQEKHVAAINYARVLETKFRKAGRDDEIGESPEYFQAIDDFIAREFDDEEAEPEVKTNGAERKVPNMQAGRQDNTQVNRSTPAGQQNGSGKLTVKLSQDENDQIRRMMAAGAITDKGKRITDFKVAQHRFAIQKHKQALADKQQA